MSVLLPAVIAAVLCTGDWHPNARNSIASSPVLTLAHDAAEPVFEEYNCRDSGRFGEARSWRLNLHGGGGVDLRRSRNTLAQGGLGLSYFIIEDLAIEGELSALHFDQAGRNAVAGNVNLLFRWHALANDHWSIYFDAGAGMMLATNRVPADGSRFNFTPQAGGGFSFEVAPNVRMLLGLRWHHISNANIFRDNPGRDSVMGYVGLSLPF